MTTFVPFDSRAALRAIAAAPPEDQDATIATQIVAPFASMFTGMGIAPGSAAIGATRM